MLDYRLLRNLDYSILIIVSIILVIGFFMIASATQANLAEGWQSLFYVKQQMIWAVLGFVLLVLVLSIDYNRLLSLGAAIYFFNLLMLAVVFVIGHKALGAQRWIQLGPIRLQPSEFAKVFIIITLAAHLSKKEGKFNHLSELLPYFIHVGIPMVLILLQPDLGTSLVFFAILFAMLYMAGAKPGHLIGIIIAGLALAIIPIVLHLKYGLPVPLKEYQLKRLIVFINPSVDPLEAGYHIIQSLIAVGSGGLWGKGWLAGTQNRLNFLPEQHTDFIFSVVGEELGFVGSFILLALYFMLFIRALHVAKEAKDVFGRLLAAGVLAMLVFHVLVNTGMTMGIMPVTGIPLPFMSYGGSSLMANFLAIGILLNVYMRRQKILF